MTRSLRALATAAALLLLAAGCTDTGSDATETSDPVGETGGDTSEVPVGTGADSTPIGSEDLVEGDGVDGETIQVGVSYLDFAELADLGAVDAGWGDQEAVWKALIEDLNTNRGGINGRTVEAIYKPYLPIGTTAAEAACLAFTQDTTVFAVLGGFVGPAEVANECIVGRGETILVGGSQNAEQLAQAKAPWVQFGATRARSTEIILSLLGDAGKLDGAKVAVIGTASTESEVPTAVAAVEAAGVEVVYDDVMTGVEGDDINNENLQWDTFTEQMKIQGATAILAVGGSTAAVRAVSTRELEVELWVTDTASLNNLGDTVTPDQANGTFAATGLDDQERWETADMQVQCVEVVRAALPDENIEDPVDVSTGEEEWHNSVMNYCTWLREFEAVMAVAGNNMTKEGFAAAVDSIGTFELPGSPFSSLGPDKFDAQDGFRLSRWDTANAENGQFEPEGDIIDVTA